MFYVKALGGFIDFTEETINTALSNTLVGIMVVFSALIIMSLIISLFGIIPKLQDIFAKKKAITTSETIDNVVNEIIEKESVEVMDNTELVAVITAALMAYLGDAAPSDGLVVRNIRRK